MYKLDVDLKTSFAKRDLEKRDGAVSLNKPCNSSSITMMQGLDPDCLDNGMSLLLLFQNETKDFFESVWKSLFSTVLMDDDMNSFYATCVQPSGAAQATCQFDGNPNGVLVSRLGADAPAFETKAALVKRQITTTASADIVRYFACNVMKPFIPDSYCVNVVC